MGRPLRHPLLSSRVIQRHKSLAAAAFSVERCKLLRAWRVA
jgi:hypothetical protein